MTTKLLMSAALMLGLYGAMPASASACTNIQKFTDSAKNSVTIVDRNCKQMKLTAKAAETGPEAEIKPEELTREQVSLFIGLLHFLFGLASESEAAMPAEKSPDDIKAPKAKTLDKGAQEENKVFCLVSVAGAGEMKGIEMTVAANETISGTGRATVETKGSSRVKFSQMIKIDLQTGRSFTVPIAKTNASKDASLSGTLQIGGKTIACE